MRDTRGVVKLRPRHERANDDLNDQEMQCRLPHSADHAVIGLLTPCEICHKAGHDRSDDDHESMSHMDVWIEPLWHNRAVAQRPRGESAAARQRCLLRHHV